MNTTTSQTRYEPVPGWAKLPMGVTFRGEATSIAGDSKDNVYVFNRGTEPIAVFDTEGNFLRGRGHHVTNFWSDHMTEIGDLLLCYL